MFTKKKRLIVVSTRVNEEIESKVLAISQEKGIAKTAVYRDIITAFFSKESQQKADN